MQQRGYSKGLFPWAEGGRGTRLRATVLASKGPVGSDAGILRGSSRPGELVGNRGTGAGVHLVGRLAVEGGMGNDGVVLLDVNGNQALHGGEDVERMEVEPPVFQRTPPRLDQRVGQGDFDLGKDPSELTETKEAADEAARRSLPCPARRKARALARLTSTRPREGGHGKPKAKPWRMGPQLMNQRLATRATNETSASTKMKSTGRIARSGIAVKTASIAAFDSQSIRLSDN